MRLSSFPVPAGAGRSSISALALETQRRNWQWLRRFYAPGPFARQTEPDAVPLFKQEEL